MCQKLTLINMCIGKFKIFFWLNCATNYIMAGAPPNMQIGTEVELCDAMCILIITMLQHYDSSNTLKYATICSREESLGMRLIWQGASSWSVEMLLPPGVGNQSKCRAVLQAVLYSAPSTTLIVVKNLILCVGRCQIYSSYKISVNKCLKQYIHNG